MRRQPPKVTQYVHREPCPVCKEPFTIHMGSSGEHLCGRCGTYSKYSTRDGIVQVEGSGGHIRDESKGGDD